MAGIFNANIFNKLVFNTGVTAGRSGWYRLWLADLQSKALQDAEKEAPKVEAVITKVAKPLPIKENADGSATVVAPIKKSKPKTVEKLVEQPEVDRMLSQFKLKPMYQMDTPPDYSEEVAQITSTLSNMIEGFKPVLARAEKRKADNDEDEDVLFLLLAA